MIVLNVGGGPTRQLPPSYEGWEQRLLDIDPSVQPDICLDAKQLGTLDPAQFDAVYCSHNLEHFYQHEVEIVLKGCLHVLKPEGIIDLAVPNIKALMHFMLSRNLDVTDVWYRAGDNPITFHDVLYGWSAQTSQGNSYYAHKCGFTPFSLGTVLSRSGFRDITLATDDSNIFAKARK